MEDGGNLATLNIKQFPDGLYRRLKARARRQRRSLAQEIIVLLDRAEADDSDTPSLLELEGLGAELWRSLGSDPAEYVRRERESWD